MSVEEPGMTELAAHLRERAALARANLSAARIDGDEYGADTYAAELADLVRRAAEHQIDLPADSDR
ncbi:hypothetical protein [Actinocorallia lasiicapitis]